MESYAREKLTLAAFWLIIWLNFNSNNNKQLLDEAEHDMKNYPDLGQYHPPQPSALADNIDLGLINWHNIELGRKPNPIIVLLHIQNSGRCKKRFAIKRLVRLTFQTAAGHFCCFVIFAALRLCHQRPIIFFWSAQSNNSRYLAEMISRLPDVQN